MSEKHENYEQFVSCLHVAYIKQHNNNNNNINNTDTYIKNKNMF